MPDKPSGGRDDLQQIKGIGQVIAQAMNSVGIHRYADLTKFTPDSLADVLRVEIVSVSPKRIEREDWIGQARALAQPANTEREPTEEGAEVAEEPEEEAPVPSPWRQHAGFSVFFDYQRDEHSERIWQTRVYHDETGEEEPFPGLETAPWVKWVFDQAELPIEPAPTLAEIPPEPAPADTDIAAPVAAETPYAVQLEILSVEVSEVKPSSETPEKQLMAEVRIKVAGPEAETVAALRLCLRIEVHAVDLETGTSELVASGESQLQSQVFEYTSEQMFPIPEVGRHELHTIVLLLPPGEMMTYHRGPTIKVVP
jgi:hypothetical protein